MASLQQRLAALIATAKGDHTAALGRIAALEGNAKITVSPTAPSNPSVGDLWVES
jgi:hypothetical protein